MRDQDANTGKLGKWTGELPVSSWPRELEYPTKHSTKPHGQTHAPWSRAGQLGHLFTGRQERLTPTRLEMNGWIESQRFLKEYKNGPSNIKVRVLLGKDPLSFRRRRERG